MPVSTGGQNETKKERVRKGSKMIDVERFKLLAEHYGLELIMEQNDLEPEDVIRLLHEASLIDIEDYFYTDVEDAEED